MASWPSSLPQCPLVAGLHEKQRDNRIVTTMDTGEPKVRRRFTAVSTLFDVSLVLTSTQVDTLMTFYNSYIEFDWQHPRTGASATCRIMSVPSFSRQGNYYVVTFVLEVLP